MDVKIKYAVVALPFLIGATVGGTMAYPAYQDYTTKQDTLNQKKTEEGELQQKLAGKAKLMNEKKTMEAALDKLRSSIPKKPELELLNIDMERMCDESGVDLISFKDAEKEDLKKAGVEEAQPEMLTSAQALKNKIKGGAKTAAAASANGGAGATANAAKGATSGNTETGLQKIVLQVKCIGDYPSLMSLVRKLETYQRVVAITSLKTSVPKAEKDKKKKIELPDDSPPGEGEDQGDYHRLNVQMLLTSYYLP